MAQMLEVNANGIDELLVPDMYDADGVIRVERSLTPDTELSWTEVAVEPLVAHVTFYQIEDPTGTTAHYYRTRFTTQGGGRSSTYSTPFRAGTLTAYASLDDLLETMDMPDDRRKNLLSDLLVDASAYIDGQCNRRFYRNPQVSGDGVFTFNVKHRWSRTLSDAIGEGIDIASITTLEVAESTGSTFTTIPLGATGFYTLPDQPQAGYPFEDVGLSNAGSQLWFPGGYGVVRLTGVLGFLSVPPLVKRATVDLARTWYQQGPGGGAAQVGVNQFNVPMYATGLPVSAKVVTDPYGPYVRKSFAWVG